MSEYKTKQKEILLDYLRQHSSSHLTAGEISAHLRESGSPVGTSTVYRRLDKLVSEGLVRKYIVDETSPACYQYIDADCRCREHFHLKCTVCGKLIHLDCSLLQKIAAHVEENHGFVIDNTKTLLYGVCAECREKQSSE